MKEHPVLFSTPMIQAILENRKTMTRRVVKWPVNGENRNGLIRLWMPNDLEKNRNEIIKRCPYGKVGNKLWVRETWCSSCSNGKTACYKTDNNGKLLAYWPQCKETIVKPSIFMPRWASRITLEITSIKVERLWDITPQDAVAEGADYMPPAKLRDERLTASQIVFAGLWDKLNAKRGYSWANNPWVWVLSFKVINAPNYNSSDKGKV